MPAKKKIKRIFTGLLVGLMLLLSGYMLIRPWYLRWGATGEEVAASMPGDLSGRRWTRAITIQGTPEEVWPWLVQWGQGRGGWYSYDWLENLFGLDIHTADQILVEYQNPVLGEDICMGKGFCISKIAYIEPNRVFGWNAIAEDDSIIWSFTLVLNPGEENTTRLLMRESFDSAAMPAAAVFALEIPDGIMAQKALNTVKGRVEGRANSPLLPLFEIGAWLLAFVAVIFSIVRAAVHPTWRRPLAVGALAIIVLLAITFLFPPLWLRGLLDLFLLGGVVWMVAQKPMGEA